jgi:hypothetical protein
VTKGESTKLISAPESTSAEYTRLFTERKTESWDGITTAAQRVRSTETDRVETKPNDTFEAVDAGVVGDGVCVVEAEFARTVPGAEDEGAADVPEVVGAGEGLCAPADRRTRSERRGQDGSFAK